MSDRTILTEVHGWTPVIDSLTKEFGFVTASVFGVIWRHCQMRDQVCTASQERLAEILGMTRVTINKHISILVKAGYLRDTTPEKKNRPHVYADTSKALIMASINSTVNDVYTPTVNGNDSTVNGDYSNTLSNIPTITRQQKPTAASADTIRSEISSEISSLPRKRKHFPHKDPNIEMMWRIWGYFPHKKIIPTLIKLFEKKLGKGGLLNEEALDKDVIDWIARGWNPRDYTKIFSNHFEKCYYMDQQDKLSTMLETEAGEKSLALEATE